MAGMWSRFREMQQLCMEDLRTVFQSLYPDLQIKTYCVPPCFMNRVPYVKQYIAGQPVFTTQLPPVNVPQPRKKPLASPHGLWTRERQPLTTPTPVQESDRRDDFVQQHVLHCLQKLGQMQMETMFVVSGLNCCDDQKRLPKTKRKGSSQTAYRKKHSKGPADEFDVLLIHRHYGFLLGEINGAGLAGDFQNKTEQEQDAELARKVQEMVKKLEKLETVLKDVMNDLSPDLTLRKTLILPYITATQLQRILAADPQLGQALCGCVGAPTAAQAVQLCVCADQLSERATPWHVPPAVLSQLHDWFQRRMASAEDPHMSSKMYSDLVARLAGAASTVTYYSVVSPRLMLRTVGGPGFGDRLARVVLSQEQMAVLMAGPNAALLTGPMGTGKTTILSLKGLQWLREGHDVHVPISTLASTQASSRLIYHQLNQTLREDPTMPPTAGKVHQHFFNINDPVSTDEAFRTLASSSVGGELHMLMDEILLGGLTEGPMYHLLLQRLSAAVPRLHLWGATPSHQVKVPFNMQVFSFTVPFRCAPSILKEVQDALQTYSEIRKYSISSLPSSRDGPGIIRLRHQGSSHGERWPVQCFQCGQDVARVLRRLNVGVSGGKAARRGTTSPDPPLMYRDVFVLTRSSALHDRLNSRKLFSSSVPNRSIPACHFVSGLRAEGIPVSVLGRQFDKKQWDEVMFKTVTAKTDEIVVSDYRNVSGLERKVVVLLEGVDSMNDAAADESTLHFLDRVSGFSRCTTQLVLVEVPHY